MREPTPIPSPGQAPTPGFERASGTTQASETTITPPDFVGQELSYFVCAMTRSPVYSKAGGIAVVITAEAERIEDIIGGVADVPTTLRSVLRVARMPGRIPMSEDLVLCDFSDPSNPIAAKTGHVLRLGKAPLDVIAEPGQSVIVEYVETGVRGNNTEDQVTTIGKGPEFLILGWPLQAVETSSF